MLSRLMIPSWDRMARAGALMLFVAGMAMGCLVMPVASVKGVSPTVAGVAFLLSGTFGVLAFRYGFSGPPELRDRMRRLTALAVAAFVSGMVLGCGLGMLLNHLWSALGALGGFLIFFGYAVYWFFRWWTLLSRVRQQHDNLLQLAGRDRVDSVDYAGYLAERGTGGLFALLLLTCVLVAGLMTEAIWWTALRYSAPYPGGLHAVVGLSIALPPAVGMAVGPSSSVRGYWWVMAVLVVSAALSVLSATWAIQAGGNAGGLVCLVSAMAVGAGAIYCGLWYGSRTSWHVGLAMLVLCWSGACLSVTVGVILLLGVSAKALPPAFYVFGLVGLLGMLMSVRGSLTTIFRSV